MDDGGHLVTLPGTDWKMWRHALLRSTGFPADGLDRLRDAGITRLADEHLAGLVSREEFGRGYARSQQQASQQLRLIATDPVFREAITWQNPAVLIALDKLAAGAGGERPNRRQRQRERVVTRYWQRYCAKTETIGFFGPVCWVRIDPAAPRLLARPGPELLSRRRVYLEHWALTRYADTVAADIDVRRFLAPRLQPHLWLSGSELLSPAQPPIVLTRAESFVLARADGRRPACQIAEAAITSRGSGLYKASEVYLLLDLLAGRGIVRWAFDLPVTNDCERLLGDQIATIADDRARTLAAAGLDRLAVAREKTAAAAGDAESLRTAIAELDAEFSALTGDHAERRPGEMYAARRVYWEEASRDIAVTVGEPVTAAISAPLAVIMQAARWLSAELARRYIDALRELYEELAGELGSASVPLGQLWFLAQGLFYGPAGRPADLVAADLASRWSRLFSLDSQNPREVRASSQTLLTAVDEIFPSQRPGWPDARLHSPDLQICAADVDAINRGEFTVVLGELHVAWATNSCAGAVSGFADPSALTRALTADLGSGRIMPLLPSEWPRITPRLAFALVDDSELQLGILPAPGADPDRLVPVSALRVSDVDGVLFASPAALADGEPASPLSRLGGRRWPLTTVFARLLSETAVEIFKLTTSGPHSPRIVIDNLVVARETWRMPVGECELIHAAGADEVFISARRWRMALGMPERVFVKVGTEVKPVYVDFAGPPYVLALAHMLRAARTAAGDYVGVSVTEMLPTPEQAWLPDAAGRRYLSELRLQLRDPARWQAGT